MIRLHIIGGAIAAILAALIGMGLYARHEHNLAASERLRANAAQVQSEVDKTGAAIADTYREVTGVIIQQQEVKADAVQIIPSDRIPDNVRSAWLSGLRHDTAEPDDHAGAEPSDPVSAAQP